jgi:hypothetical protein
MSTDHVSEQVHPIFGMAARLRQEMTVERDGVRFTFANGTLANVSRHFGSDIVVDGKLSLAFTIVGTLAFFQFPLDALEVWDSRNGGRWATPTGEPMVPARKPSETP